MGVQQATKQLAILGKRPNCPREAEGERVTVCSTSRFGFSRPVFSLTLTALLLLACASFARAADAQPSSPHFEIRRFDVEGNTLLDAAAIEAAVSRQRGTGKTFADIEVARDALQQRYYAAGFGAVQVFVPEQEIQNGVVRLRVVEARTASVMVSGAKFHGEANIKASVPGLQVGQSPNTLKIAESLDAANENPSKQTRLSFKAGAKAGDIDATLQVTDEKPWRFFATLDNTGTPATGRLRLGFGYQHANVFDRDHVFTARYITAPEKLNDVSIYGLSYRIPLYSLGDSLEFFGGYSDVDSGIVADVFNVSGKGTVFGARYNQRLAKRGDYQSGFVYGVDYRAYENFIDFAGLPIGNDVTVRPVSFGYFGRLATPTTTGGFFLTLVRNIPGGSKGSDAAFAAARAGADNDFSLLRYGFDISRWVFGDWQLLARLEGQYTDEPLVPGEQIGLGGVNSVRGFRERELADDRGYFGSIELATPDFSRFIGLGNGTARGVVFYDFGNTSRVEPLPGEPHGTSIASVGAGLRFVFGKNVNMRFDYARVVDGGGSRQRDDDRLHFSLAWVY